TVRSSSPELFDQRATVAFVNLDKQFVSLILDDKTYECCLLEQCRIFSQGDHLWVTVGPHRGCVGMVMNVLEEELVLCS
ncbi:hypothetical protein J3R83DRAFT_8804, partial [Lanmaoa asiatica]